MSQESRMFKRRLLNAQIVKCPKCKFFVRLRYRHSGDRARWEVCKPCLVSLMTPEELNRYRQQSGAAYDWAGLLPI